MELVAQPESSTIASKPNQGSEPKTKWLADAKRFNAQQIRRRMMEQKQRFGTKADKDPNEVASPHDGIFKPSKPLTPQLTIAISMSEEADDPAPQDHSHSVSLSLDAGNDADASAWAMMEHYEISGSRSRSSPYHRFESQEESSQSLLLRDASSFWDKSQDSSPSETYSSSISPSTQQIFLPTGTTRRQVLSPTKKACLFDWNVHSPPATAPVCLAQEQDTAIGKDDDDDDSETRVNADAGPTPAILRTRWIKENKLAENTESPTMSLLQVSLIPSDGANTTTMSSCQMIPSETSSVDAAADEDETYDQSFPPATHTGDKDNLMQLSKISLQPSIIEDSPVSKDAIQDANTVADEILVRQLPQNYHQLDKIDHLERIPKEPIDDTNDLQLKLKERVAELELTLRGIAATPKGTILQENPLKILLDRNQTLVKEVRFADSTCVELSAKVSSLEAERRILQDRVASLERENREFRTSCQTSRVVTSSSEKDKITKMSLSCDGVANHFQRNTRILRQSVHELRTEISTLANEQAPLPVISLAGTLLSGIDTGLGRELDGTTNVIDESLPLQWLAKALEVNTLLLKEQKLNQEELNAARSRVEELEKEVVEKTVVVDTNEAWDLSRAQEESDFLGRQLGNVQEKLDQTRQDLEEEKIKTFTIDRQWRAHASGQLRKMKLFEDQLEKASQLLFTANISNSESSGRRFLESHVTRVEQDLLHAKRSLLSLKADMQAVLSNGAADFTLSLSSTGDAQVVSLVAATLDRMRRQYASLNFQVEQAVAHNCSRLESLSQTVAFLRSSFMFEIESVSTENETRPDHNRSVNSSRRSLWQTQEEVEVDDDMYSRMEEARGSLSQLNDHQGDFSSELDDLSRFFSDDSTLESMLKTVASEKSRFVDADLWKKPLEAAIRECQRVRDRSVALKEDLKNEKIAFSQLEMENQRLLVSSSLKEEEKQLVQQALAEAKARIQQLESKIQIVLEDKDRREEKFLTLEKRVDFLEDEKSQLEDNLKDVMRYKEHLEEQLDSYQSQADTANSQLQVAQVGLEEHAKDVASLKLAMEETETRLSEADNLLLDSRCQQERMRKERAELKRKLALCESEAQSLTDKLKKVRAKSEDQTQELSKVNRALQMQKDETETFMRRLARVDRDIFAIFEKQEVDASSSDFASSFGFDWSRLEQLVPFILASLNQTAQKENEVVELKKNISLLREDYKRTTVLGEQYKKQAEEENKQNEKLLEFLRQAELEMERSANQNREMSHALSKLQQQESEMLSKTRSAEKDREEMRSKFVQIRTELCLERNVTQKRCDQLSQEKSIKQKVEDELRSTIVGLEEKCVRLKHCVKKLTHKCEEWEITYERQGKSVVKLQARNSRMRDKICEMAAKYKLLHSHIRSSSRVHSEDREKWVGERNDLQLVHAQLEKELETITHELSNLEPK